jgi:hypothetical protein
MDKTPLNRFSMKAFTFLFSSLFFGLYTKAQTVTYQPFHGNHTNYGYEIQSWNGSEVVTYHTKTVWEGDTLIGGENYTRIYKMGQYSGGVREDIANQQRYFLDLNNVEKNISISHFLEVGDTLSDSSVFLNAFRTYFDEGFIYQSFDTLIVGQVDSVLEANGTYSNTYYFEKPSAQLAFFTYNTYRGLLNLDQLEYHVNQFCYRELDSTGSINPAITICDLGMEENKLLDITISPNPSTDFVKLSGEDLGKIQSVIIYDVQGKLMKQFTWSEIQTKLPVSELENGIYMLALNGDSKIIRLIKQ